MPMDMPIAVNPIVRDALVPCSVLVRTSLPCQSVPNGCSRLASNNESVLYAVGSYGMNSVATTTMPRKNMIIAMPTFPIQVAMKRSVILPRFLMLRPALSASNGLNASSLLVPDSNFFSNFMVPPSGNRHPRVEFDQHEVRHQVRDHDRDPAYQEHELEDRVVLLVDCVYGHPSQALVAEHDLYLERASQDERGVHGQGSHHGKPRVRRRVVLHDLLLGQALGVGGDYVLLGQDVYERVPLYQHYACDGSYRKGGTRQGQVPQDVTNHRQGPFR